MLLPVRCYTCGKVLGHLGDRYKSYEKPLKFFEDYHIERYCCRRIFLCHVDVQETAPSCLPDSVEMIPNEATKEAVRVHFAV